MKVTLVLRAVNKESLASLKNILDKTLSEAPQYLSKVKLDQQKIVFDRIKRLNKWYTKIIGLDEVQVYQERVTALQDQLLKTQTRRREVNKQLSEIRQKAQEIQSQIQHIDRKEKFDVYSQLINDERTILNMERSISATFQEFDQAERDLFTAYTNAVRDSQEKQRAQLEYSKYIGLAFSFLGSFLAFAYTTFWKQDLKLYIKDEILSIKHLHLNTNIQQELQQILKKIDVRDVKVQQELYQILKNLDGKGQENTHESVCINQHLAKEFSEDSTLIVVKYVGVGFLGYVFFKILFG